MLQLSRLVGNVVPEHDNFRKMSAANIAARNDYAKITHIETRPQAGFYFEQVTQLHSGKVGLAHARNRIYRKKSRGDSRAAQSQHAKPSPKREAFH